MTNNKETYKKIREELDRNPELKAATLCSKWGASYGGFRYWDEREGKKKKPKGTNGASKDAITAPVKSVKGTDGTVNVVVPVKLTDLATAYVAGKGHLEVELMEVVSHLDAEKMRELLGLMGKKRD
jgi:hypothetical protein